MMHQALAMMGWREGGCLLLRDDRGEADGGEEEGDVPAFELTSADASGGGAAVAFQVELALEGVVTVPTPG